MLGVGQLVLTADETLDITPTTLVNLSLIHIENVTGDSEISLADATVVEGDGLDTINLTRLNESALLKYQQRLEVIPSFQS